MKKRLIVAGLALLMLLTVGCNKTEDLLGENMTEVTGTAALSAATDAQTTVIEQTEPIVEVDPLEDELGEFDFGGYTYRVLSCTYDPAAAFTMFDTEGITGDILNDAIYQRNREIEERFHIVFVASEGSYSSNYQTLTTSVSAGADEYDMIQVINRNAFSAGLAGQLASVDSMTYLNPSKAYYMQEMNNQLSISGKNFFYYSEESVHAFERACCLIFNKSLVEAYHLEDYYELVRTGKWTLEKFYSEAQKVAEDLDGNGVYNEADRYGIIGTADYLFASIYNGAGEMTVRKDNDDIPYFAAITSERFTNVIDQLLNEMNGGHHIRLNNKAKYDQTVSEFTANSALFAATVVGRVANVKEMTSDYGLLPFPKYDEGQEAYYSRVIDGWLHVVPATNPDPERTSVIMEALASGTAREFIPAYYDNVLSMRALRDEDSVEMLDLIRSTRVMDLGECPWFENVRKKYSYDLLFDQSIPLASLNASIEKSVNAVIKEAIQKLNSHS